VDISTNNRQLLSVSDAPKVRSKHHRRPGSAARQSRLLVKQKQNTAVGLEIRPGDVGESSGHHAPKACEKGSEARLTYL